MQENICYIIVKCSCGPLIAWECFSWSGVVKLVDITGIINVDKYISILNENLEEASIKRDLEEEFVCNQVNETKHNAKKIIRFFKEFNIKLLEWLN